MDFRNKDQKIFSNGMSYQVFLKSDVMNGIIDVMVLSMMMMMIVDLVA